MKLFSVLLLALAVLAGCSKSSELNKLEKGTPLYTLAKDLSKKVPALDPDKNAVLARSKYFTLTVADVMEALKENYGNRVNSLPNLQTEQVRSIIEAGVKELADRRLLLHAAQQAGVTVTDAEVDSLLQAQYARVGGKERFATLLEQNGITEDVIRKQLYEMLQIQKYLEKELKDAEAVSEEEIQQAYQEDKTATVRHILLSTQGKSKEEKAKIHQKMEKLLERARSGEDFAELAKQYSEDPGSKENGGLYADFPRGKMVPPFDSAAFNTPVGQISGIVETQFGYHILQILDRKKETRPLSEVHDELAEQVRRQKQTKAYNQLLAKLRKEAELTFETI
ncbi:MAG: hypothetical protein D6715_00705 [Calditrichaeota bacterium]|nr:MAG: hypothetical protein D6715_00705 [Calditrichota bacterium]